MLTVCTWLWGDKFGPDDARKLASGLARNLKTPHRFLVVTDRPERFVDASIEALEIPLRDRSLTSIKGCFARLRMFDPAWQRSAGIDDRVIGIDLDTVITGPLDPVFDREEPFVIMQGGNASNPCPFNGALILLRAGAHAEVWSDFNLDAAQQIPYFSFPDDQGWLWHKIPDAPGWKCGASTGVYVYQKPGWPGGKAQSGLPEGSRLVTFINRHPSQFTHLDWVQEHWRL